MNGQELLIDKPVCAYCRNVLEDEYLMVRDNFLLIKYFETEESNMFCDEYCLAESLFADTVDLEEY